jgi:RNA polymerase sigma factor (sigma-70 family)
MIFNAKDCLPLVIEWQQSRKAETLASIIQFCKGLTEAIASSYGPIYRDDLIQEGYARIVYALPYFNKSAGKLHTFLTTVIHNACRTYLKRQTRNDVDELTELSFAEVYVGEDTSILTDCICRNRQRFPSLPVDRLDAMTSFIIEATRMEITRSGIITGLIDRYGVARNIAKVLYYSTIIYLRGKLLDQRTWGDVDKNPTNEFTLYEDFKSLLGAEAYKRLSLILHDLPVQYP